jgi:crossover junction endodeoxyribonuclease RusA
MAITYVTTEANEYKAKVQAIARAAGLDKPLAGRIKLELWLFPHRPKDWEARQRKYGEGWDDGVRCIDLGNCEKILSDALNGICFVDDGQHRQIIKQRMEPDERGARVIVRISAMSSSKPQGVLL